ncbi:hypothetical protein [Solicola gregarius]|uniref:Uncharacterized protein n=1 Tax=Solicola gregarius TaxID=2908642 RepID=A0AA46TJM5_9ACTN|nr:hypothetical protein [Solicola gregarius]UYM06486.1 hypothetical protein L0C25_05275 [Solicola gregarius]
MTSTVPSNWRSRVRPETPAYAAWAPSESSSSRAILAELRGQGFVAQIGSRAVPAGNFEVCYLRDQQARVEEIILGLDPEATRLTVGR